MHIESSSLNGQNCVRAIGESSISHAGRFHSAVCDLLHSVENPSVDCSGLTSMDVPLIQVLLAAQKTLPALEVHIPNDADSLDWLKQTGVDNLFHRASA